MNSLDPRIDLLAQCPRSSPPQALKPDLLINAGTAGGFESKGMGIGDVLVSSTIHNHDRRMLLPIFVDYGVHNHAAVATSKLREVRPAFPAPLLLLRG